MTDLQELQTIASKYSTGISVEKIASNVYFMLAAKYGRGKAAVLNTRYLEYKDHTYQFIKHRAKDEWEVKLVK